MVQNLDFWYEKTVVYSENNIDNLLRRKVKYKIMSCINVDILAKLLISTQHLIIMQGT